MLKRRFLQKGWKMYGVSNPSYDAKAALPGKDGKPNDAQMLAAEQITRHVVKYGVQERLTR